MEQPKHCLPHPRNAAPIVGLLAGLIIGATACVALAAEPVPSSPDASTRVPDGVTSITQRREQNAVTSVRVQRGDNIYHVTPPEQVPYYQEGGRAATWEIFQFRSRPRADIPAPPPPGR
jgi:hypothetical protein